MGYFWIGSQRGSGFAVDGADGGGWCADLFCLAFVVLWDAFEVLSCFWRSLADGG